MNAANRPIDFLLNTDSVKVSQTQRRESILDSGVSSSKTREKSFDDVYRQQQRENAQIRQNNQAERRHDNANRAESRAETRQQQSQAARSDGADKRVQKEVSEADNGKVLPPQQRLATADTRSRTKENTTTDNDASVAGSSKDVEVTVSFDSGLLTAAEVEQDADAPAFSLAGQNEQGDEQALEAVVLQAQQSAAEQQAKAVTADGSKEFKQSVLADTIASNTKSDVNVATTTKAGATGTETNSQNQFQERLIPVTTGQEFKLLREQLSVAKPSVVAGKEGAIDASTSTSTSTESAAAGLNSLTQASQALSATRPSTVTASVQTPVNSADWGQAVSQRIMWLVNRGISSAELQLNPRDLGPVEVRINVSGEQTTVQFTSQQPAVREALESSVVRLREMMESSGLDLADVNVSDQSPSEQAQSDSRGSSGSSSGDDNNDIEGGVETQVTQRIESDGLVDFYA